MKHNIQSRLTALVLSGLFSCSGFCDDAEITGETYLGLSGKSATIKFHSQICYVRSISDFDIENFKIVLECDGASQILWDINNPGSNSLNYDDPKFELLWAGDIDNDYKIDLKMNMSPKYSCTRPTVYLSSLAKDGELVGVKGKPEYKCE